VFSYLEKVIQDLNWDQLWECLPNTVAKLQNALRQKHVVFLSYPNIPPLFEQELLESLARKLNSTLSETVVVGWEPSPDATDRIRLIRHPTSDQIREIAYNIIRDVLESRGENRFLLFCSEQAISYIRNDIRSFEFVSELAEMIGTVEDDAQRVEQAISEVSGAELPGYRETNLANIVLAIALLRDWCREERTERWSADLIETVAESTLVIDRREPFTVLPYNKLLSLPSPLVHQLAVPNGIFPRLLEIPRFEGDYYYFSIFRNWVTRDDYNLGALIDRLASEANSASFANRVKALLAYSHSPYWLDCVGALQRIYLRWYARERSEPRLPMSLDLEEDVQNWQRVSSLCRKVYRYLTDDDVNLEEAREWRSIAERLEPHAFVLFLLDDWIGYSTCRSDLRETYDFYREAALLDDSFRRVHQANIALKVLESQLLFHILMPRAAGIDEDSKLLSSLSGVFGVAMKRSLLDQTEAGKLAALAEVLAKLDPIYTFALEKVHERREVKRYLKKAEDLASDDLPAMVDLWIEVCRRFQYGAIPADSEIAPRAANRYIELTDRLIKDYQECVKGTNDQQISRYDLISTTLDELISMSSNFDQVFLLVVDAFSYVEWRRCREQFLSALDRDNVEIQDEYRLSVLPTITPVDTTAIFTGYLPAQTGLFGQRIVDAQDVQYTLIAQHKDCDPVRVIYGQDTRYASAINNDDAPDVEGEQIDYLVVNHRAVAAAFPAVDKRHSFYLLVNENLAGTPLTYLHAKLGKVARIDLRQSQVLRAAREIRGVLDRGQIQEHMPIVIYIPNFDEEGHNKVVDEDDWQGYYDFQALKLQKDLVGTLVDFAERQSGRSIIVLTADHGKFTTYDQDILRTAADLHWLDVRTEVMRLISEVVPSEDFRMDRGGKYCNFWIPQEQLAEVRRRIEPVLARANDVIALIGASQIRSFFPGTPISTWQHPNIVLISKYEFSPARSEQHQHGGASLSELVVPFIKFIVDGRS